VSAVDRWLEEHRDLIDPGVRQRARIVAHLYGGDTVSGQALAARLGVSRAAVHKHMESLREAGASVASAPGSGYLLDPPLDLLAPEFVLPLLAMSSARLGIPYHYECSTASTNTLARERGRAGSPHGTVVLTDYQHTGRGRLGRTWVSEPGKDLTFSVLLRPDLPPERASRLTLAASVAVAGTLAGVDGLGARVSIKWPNDILVDGRKICGILSEAALDMDALHWAVVGIGLNVNGRPSQTVDATTLPPGAVPPLSVREIVGEECRRAPLLVALLLELDRTFSSTEDAGWDDVLGAFARMDALVGRRVEVLSVGAEPRVAAAGVARGLGSEGELLVEDASGRLQAVLSGDVTLRSSEA
jgi:BirA family biotin operon repressor/biotin-[acetyl-CoA-carboxylase] ligase